MNYELAKQLKDAGFPNSRDWCMVPIHWSMGHIEPCMTPILVELIEACVSSAKDIGLFKLEHRENANPELGQYFWWAFRDYEEATGDTPEEAVANLWLKLK
jgi:hypothetical protein